MNQEIPASIINQLEDANCRFVDQTVLLENGEPATVTKAHSIQDKITGRWFVVLSFSNKTAMRYNRFLALNHY